MMLLCTLFPPTGNRRRAGVFALLLLRKQDTKILRGYAASRESRYDTLN